MMLNSDENVALDNLRLKLWDNYLMQAHSRWVMSYSKMINWLMVLVVTLLPIGTFFYWFFTTKKISFLAGVVIYIFIILFFIWLIKHFRSFYFVLHIDGVQYHCNFYRNRCEFCNGKYYIVINKKGYKLKKDFLFVSISGYKFDDILNKNIDKISLCKNTVLFSADGLNYFLTDNTGVPINFYYVTYQKSKQYYYIDFFSNDTKEGVVYFPKLLLKAFEENGIEPPKDDRIVYIEGIDVRNYLDKKKR